jgi:hypothetical protein
MSLLDAMDAKEQGAVLFEAQPELLAAAVWHEAAKHYKEIDAQREFVNAYISARLRRDEYRREKEDEK